MLGQPIGLAVFFIPAQIEPFQAVENGVERGLGVAVDIRVVDAQDHRAAGVTRIKPVENKGARAPDVEEAGGLGCEADARGHETSGYRSSKNSCALIRQPDSSARG